MMQGTYSARIYVQPRSSFEEVHPKVFRVSPGAELLSMFGTPALYEAKLGKPELCPTKQAIFRQDLGLI